MSEENAAPDGGFEGSDLGGRGIDGEEPTRRFDGPTVLASMAVLVTLIVVGLCVPVAYSAWTRTRVPVDGFEVVNVYPHDSNAFTQGLIYADLGGDIGPAFFESTGLEGASSVRRVEIETGRVLQKAALPNEVFGEGLTLIGRQLYQLTWRAGIGYVYDARTFERVGTFPLPRDERTGRRIEGWGLTTDGESLIISDGSYKLYFLNPESFDVTKVVEVRDDGRPIVRLNELEFINQEIWANVWKHDSIVRISPKSGVVQGYIDCTGLGGGQQRFTDEDVMNGIAFDRKRQRIFVTGKLWPKLYEIRVVEKPRR